MKPRIDGDGVPRCSESECPAYDGKRCKLIGYRPSAICEPAVIDMADRLRPPAPGAEAMREAAAKVCDREAAIYAEEVLAALNAWEQAYRFNELEAAGKELARLLRESQPAPAVGEDEALLADIEKIARYAATATIMDIARRGCARLRAALADVARLTEELERERVRLAGCGVAALGCATGDNAITPDSYGWSASLGDVLDLRQKYDEARAALAAAVEEEREACAMECEREAVTYAEAQDVLRRDACDDCAGLIRARVGRNQ